MLTFNIYLTIDSIDCYRNPLERLVSSYREKIFGARPGTLHDRLRRKITQKFRRVRVPNKRNLPEDMIPTFKEFAQFIISEAEKEKEPEMHWAPVYSFCNPCQVFYLERSMLLKTCLLEFCNI